MLSYGYIHDSRVYRIGCPNEPTKLSGVPQAAAAATLSTAAPLRGYRRNVGICLVNPSKKIFTASKINVPDTWQMPQGGAGKGEDLRNAALRELREETGVTSAEFLAEAPYWLTYEYPIEVRRRMKPRLGWNYKGQSQKWFLFKFTGKEEEINLLGDGSEEPEFKHWTWLLPEQVVEQAVYFRRPIYEQVMKLFSPYLRTDEGNFFAPNRTTPRYANYRRRIQHKEPEI